MIDGETTLTYYQIEKTSTMRMMKSVFLAASTLVLMASTARAGFVFAGHHTLVANRANQVVNIFANPSFAGEIAQGLNFNLAVDDGGSVIGGVDNNAPKITAVNLKPLGGLFAGIPESQSNVFASQKLYQVNLAPQNEANRPTISNNSLLAQVTFDTTGLTSGTWILDLDGIPARAGFPALPSSSFANDSTTITNGSLTVPEPSSLWMTGAVVAALLGAWFARRISPVARN